MVAELCSEMACRRRHCGHHYGSGTSSPGSCFCSSRRNTTTRWAVCQLAAFGHLFPHGYIQRYYLRFLLGQSLTACRHQYWAHFYRWGLDRRRLSIIQRIRIPSSPSFDHSWHIFLGWNFVTHFWSVELGNPAGLRLASSHCCLYDSSRRQNYPKPSP